MGLQDNFPVSKAIRLASSIIAPAAFRHRGGDTRICFSHLRWDFVFQRPQHLMTRFAKDRRVVIFEEPTLIDGEARLDLRPDATGVTVAVPRLPHGVEGEAAEAQLKRLLDGLVVAMAIERPVLWYYTPMMLAFSRDLAETAGAAGRVVRRAAGDLKVPQHGPGLRPGAGHLREAGRARAGRPSGQRPRRHGSRPGLALGATMKGPAGAIRRGLCTFRPDACSDRAGRTPRPGRSRRRSRRSGHEGWSAGRWPGAPLRSARP
jgi:hypothetical protein